MAKPPAEVRFPGDQNRRKRIRVRGIKKASKEIQKKLERNLNLLLDDPEIFMPEIEGEIGKISFFGAKDKMALTLRELSVVASKRNDSRWLRKRMTKRGGDPVCKALAGCLLAALEGDLSTVSVFKHPLYGNSSFLRRGDGKQSHQVGIQNFTNSKLRLLVWDDHAKSGQYFFSWDKGFVFTGESPEPPIGWTNWILDNSSVNFSGDEIKWTLGLNQKNVEEDELTDQGWLKLEFRGGVKVGISASALAKTETSFTQSIGINMMPPNKLGEICSADWMWMPKGWPKDRKLPTEGELRLKESLDTWLRMSLEDNLLARLCKSSILNSIEDGYVVKDSWFGNDDIEEFLEFLDGSDEEKSAIRCVLDSLENGLHVRNDGVVIDLDHSVVRLEDSSCHPILVALWPDFGEIILKDLFNLKGDDAEKIIIKQKKRKQGFGAFLRELGDNLEIEKRLDRLPWNNSELPIPLAFADSLVRKAIEEGVASTVPVARKGKGLENAMGWAWLVVQERTESDAWRFDEDSRDKGGDWVPALQALWDSAEELLIRDNLDAVSDYRSAMKWLSEICGIGKI